MSGGVSRVLDLAQRGVSLALFGTTVLAGGWLVASAAKGAAFHRAAAAERKQVEAQAQAQGGGDK